MASTGHDNYDSKTSIDITEINTSKPLSLKDSQDNINTFDNVFGGLNKIIKAIINKFNTNSTQIEDLTSKVNRIGKTAGGRWELTNVNWAPNTTYHKDILIDGYVHKGTITVAANVTNNYEDGYSREVTTYTRENTASTSFTENGSYSYTQNATASTRIDGGIHHIAYSKITYNDDNKATCTFTLTNNPETLQATLSIDVTVGDRGDQSRYEYNFKADSLIFSYELY